MGDSYVVKGAKLKCSCGDQECSLQLMNHDSKIKGKEQANIMDFAPMMNVLPFGMCSSMLNPALIAAKAASNGAVQKVPCIPVIPAPWLGGKMNKLVKGAPALLKSSTLMCAYMGQIKIQDDGMGGHDQVEAKGAKVASEKQESKSEGLKEENKSEDERDAEKTNNPSLKPEHAKIVKERIQNMNDNMTEGEKARTTYSASLVELKDGTQEMWVSGAGKKGYVPPRIRGNDKVIANKVEDADSINRFNDAEQTIMRETDVREAKILAMGATRDMCEACQNAAKSRKILDKVVTPLKKIN